MLNTNRLLFASLLLLPAVFQAGAYAQSNAFSTVSAGNWTAFVSPDSVAAGFGVNFASTTTSAPSLPLGTTLGNATITITDSAGTKTPAQLYLVSPAQINFLIPSTAAVGRATVNVTAGGTNYSGTVDITTVSPAIFTANMNGIGVAAAQILRVSASGQVTTQDAFQAAGLMYQPAPITLSPSTDKVYLILYGTGIRRHSTNPVKATINGVSVPVLYAAAQSTLPGLDQINLGPLPQSLAGTGKTALNVSVLVDGIPTNTSTIAIQ